MGPTMLQQLVRYLFTACIDASGILGVDEEFRTELIAKRSKLAPTQIGSDGRIMEWLEEYREPEPRHRHVSHLWGLYPADEISAFGTPELARAARKSLEVRGDDGVGWSIAYKAALWARLRDGERAWGCIRKAMQPAYGMEIRYDGGGGVYPNLFDASPPFQIDGNFGVTAAIAELLVQSEPGIIHLLPALPEAWKQGRVTGLRARGGYVVDIAWEGARLISATIRAVNPAGPCQIGYGGKTVTLNVPRGKVVTVDAALEPVRLPR
jgi:alpha-L-fucosidase 2